MSTENQLTKKPFGSRLPNNSDLNRLQNEEQIYVDKTLTILQLITETRFSLITRPQRFGKSLYLNTIRAIAEKDEAIKLLAIGMKYDDLKKYPVLNFDFSNCNQEISLELYIGNYLKEHEKKLQITSTELPVLLRLKNVLEGYGECYVLIDEYDNPI